ncbi:hypothetical protein [Arthrobacter sp. LFS091]|uniref:hypothetical protein n=1 Tax=Arthrobacter sp. LFS091 TaxID=3229892 RepID=UPI003A805518
MPSNVLAVKEGEPLRRTLVSVAPQARAFFTKPPNDPEFAVYQLRDDGSLESLMQTPQTRPENYFGLSRKPRGCRSVATRSCHQAAPPHCNSDSLAST